MERQLNIQQKQLERNRIGCVLVPNRYGIDYDIGEVDYDKLIDYRKVVMPGRPASIELDCTVENVIREFEVEESRSELSSGIMSPFYTDPLRCAQRGFPKATRLTTYLRLLNVEQRYAKFSAG